MEKLTDREKEEREVAIKELEGKNGKRNRDGIVSGSIGLIFGKGGRTKDMRKEAAKLLRDRNRGKEKPIDQILKDVLRESGEGGGSEKKGEPKTT